METENVSLQIIGLRYKHYFNTLLELGVQIYFFSGLDFYFFYLIKGL